MSFTNKPFSKDEIEKMPSNSANEGSPRRVPRQLEEVLNLTKSINRLLEDCSIEWKATVSQKQWKIVDSKPVTQTPWQSSIVVRTYFIEKDLDEAFQTLLISKTMFTEHLSYFLTLLKGKDSPHAKEPQVANQSSSLMQTNQPRTNKANLLDLSFIEGQKTNTKTLNNPVSDVQRSFTDLMKAKIIFDAKFISFNAILNGTNCSSMDPTKCLCQICSNVMETIAEGKIRNLTTKPRRSKRINKTKRLTRTKRTRKRGRKPNSFNKIDQTFLTSESETETNF